MIDIVDIIAKLHTNKSHIVMSIASDTFYIGNLCEIFG
jgi:hypothetical protein